jgi:hypothetical protein
MKNIIRWYIKDNLSLDLSKMVIINAEKAREIEPETLARISASIVIVTATTGASFESSSSYIMMIAFFKQEHEWAVGSPRLLTNPTAVSEVESSSNQCRDEEAIKLGTKKIVLLLVWTT